MSKFLFTAGRGESPAAKRNRILRSSARAARLVTSGKVPMRVANRMKLSNMTRKLIHGNTRVGMEDTVRATRRPRPRSQGWRK